MALSVGQRVVLLFGFLDQACEIGLERRQASGTREGFIKTKEKEDNGGAAVLEVLMRTAEILRTNSRLRFIAREAEVAYHQLVFRKSTMEKGFPPILMLHAFAQRIANQADMVAGREGHFCSGEGRGRGRHER